MTLFRCECPKLSNGMWIIKSLFQDGEDYFSIDFECEDYYEAKEVFNAQCESMNIEMERKH